MNDQRPVAPAPAPDTLQKGLLQLLWTTRPWLRNTILLVAGLVAFVMVFVPQGVREDALRKLFGIKRPEGVAKVDVSDENSHVLRLKNGHLVRLVGRVVHNGSNVTDAVLVDAIESDAWRYGYSCYDQYFGQQGPPLPGGAVTVEFDVIDQLPQNAKVGASDFAVEAFGRCVVGVLAGQTINAAGPLGKGHVVYALRFVPN